MKLKLSREKRLLIYKILLFAFAFVLAFMPVTASRNIEVNSRVIVEMLGVDKTDEGLEITAQYATPSDADKSSTKDKVSVKADSLTMAIDALDVALGRRVDLGQCSVVVAGAELDTDVLGTLLTATDVTADVYLTASTDKAGELVGDLTELMKKTGVTDADFIAYSCKRAHIATTTLLKFLSDLNSASHTAYLPVVEMIESESDGQGGSSGGEQGGGGSSGGGEQSGQSGGEQAQKEKTGMKVEKLAVYNTNGRAGVLESDAARGVAWASSHVENSIIVADVEYDGETIRDVSGRLVKKKSVVKVDAKNNKATVELCVTIEPNGDKFNILDAKNSGDVIGAVKAGFADKIKSELDAAYRDSIELDCDPLFIGREFHRREPEYFSTLELETVDVAFDVNVTLK